MRGNEIFFKGGNHNEHKKTGSTLFVDKGQVVIVQGLSVLESSYPPNLDNSFL